MSRKPRCLNWRMHVLLEALEEPARTVRAGQAGVAATAAAKEKLVEIALALHVLHNTRRPPRE